MSKLQLLLSIYLFSSNLSKRVECVRLATVYNNTSFTDNSTDSPDMTTNDTNLDLPGLLSDDLQRYNLLNFAFSGIYAPIMLTIGIIGNSVTIGLLHRGVLKSSSSIYLIGLSVSDLIYLSLSFPSVGKAYPSIYGAVFWEALYGYYLAYVIPIVYAQFATSVWIIVAFTVERLFVVAFPIKSKQSSSTIRPKIIVVSIYMFGICLNLPRNFMYSVVTNIDPDTGESYLAAEMTDFGKNPNFTAANFWLSFLFNNALPFLIIGTLNTVIVIKLGAAKRKALSLTSQETGKSSETRKSRDSQITRLLFAIVVAFFVCNSLGAALSISVALNGYRLKDPTFRMLLLFANCLIQTNSVINFVLYATCSSTMRNAIKELVCKKSMKTKQETKLSVCISSKNIPSHN